VGRSAIVLRTNCAPSNLGGFIDGFFSAMNIQRMYSRHRCISFFFAAFRDVSVRSIEKSSLICVLLECNEGSSLVIVLLLAPSRADVS